MTDTLRCSALGYLKVVGRHRNKILLYLCFPSDFPSQLFHSLSPYPFQWKSNLMLESTLLCQCWFLPGKPNELEYSWHCNGGTDYAACSPYLLQTAGRFSLCPHSPSCRRDGWNETAALGCLGTSGREWFSTPWLVLCSLCFLLTAPGLGGGAKAPCPWGF